MKNETLFTMLLSLRRIFIQTSVLVTKCLMNFSPVKLRNLNPYCTNLLQANSTNKRKFICVMKSADAYKLTHNEISNNILKCKKISELRWKDELIESYL